MLPPVFEERMRAIPVPEPEAFLTALNEAPLPTGLRRNPLRPGGVPLGLEPVPWCSLGYYVPEGLRPGTDPRHDAGAYYLQEVSAMAVGEAADIRPGLRVLDLCAAPGGKAGHMGSLLGHTGFLLANEIVPDRARLLSSQLERLGLREMAVTNERPDRLAAHFGAVFDRVLVDAPCSGEGMFRKDPGAAEAWEPQSNEACAHRQRLILESAAQLVRPGGRLLYSTCTFSPLENEDNAAWFLAEHPEFAPVSVAPAGWSAGLNGETHCARLWPQFTRGEGHFLACFRRMTGEEDPWPAARPLRREGGADDFWREAMEGPLPQHTVLRGGDVWISPTMEPSWGDLKVLRSGVPAGKPGKGYFRPHHSLAMAFPSKRTVELGGDPARLSAYLRGEEIAAEGSGWCTVTVDGCPLGWGKASGGRLKNHLPTGLRRHWSAIDQQE